MSQATDLNSTPMPSPGTVRLQIEGLATALLYVACFGWFHLGAGTEFVSTKVLAVFFAGLIVIPLVTGLPLAMLRRAITEGIAKPTSVAAFLPFAHFALYALQGILVWVATREAYAWVFFRSPLAS